MGAITVYGHRITHIYGSQYEVLIPCHTCFLDLIAHACHLNMQFSPFPRKLQDMYVISFVVQFLCDSCSEALALAFEMTLVT